MRENCTGRDILKRRLRKLKKLEARLRFGTEDHVKRPLVWDEFFGLQSTKRGKARYSLEQLEMMDRDRYREVVSEYFYHMYYRIYQENGILPAGIFDPELLAQMGLPFDADGSELKKRFRQLAKIYHPDKGGDEASFIDMMEKYRKICGS